jgi:pyruvate/2-oxoglutarate dehydrogenase complex dihydrolipoamide acyltransferase (E2) component
MEIRVEGGTADDEIEILAVEVSVGQEVAEGDMLVEVATDKANMEVLAPVAGRVTAVNVAEGDDAPGDTVLVVLEAAG